MSYAELTLSQKAMYDESHVERISTGVSMRLPTISQLQQKYPHLTFNDDDWKPVSRELKAFALAKLPAPAAPILISDVRAGARANASDVPALSNVEARVRELKGDRLAQVAASNNITVDIHPTNPGITAMRRKNALLTLFRHGSQIANL